MDANIGRPVFIRSARLEAHHGFVAVTAGRPNRYYDSVMPDAPGFTYHFPL